MSSAAKSEFFSLVRDDFAPALRDLGFKGSGQNFRRIRGEVINIVNIQGNKYGGSVAVNLGLHLTFLPASGSINLPETSKIKEVDCEFRQRLVPRGRFDYWWKYDGFFGSPQKRVNHLVSTYLNRGEPRFLQFDSVEKIANMLQLDEIVCDKTYKFFGYVHAVRGALVMARVNRHIGNAELAVEFAKAGLKKLGRVTSLKPALEEFLNAT